MPAHGTGRPGQAAPAGRSRPPVYRRSSADRPSPPAAQLAEEPVMAEPSDQTPAAAGRGDLRASHADRDRVISTLKAAFVQGRLTKDELDSRVSQTLAARTYAELGALTADLPAGLADAGAPGRATRAQARRPMSNAAKAGIWVIIAVG